MNQITLIGHIQNGHITTVRTSGIPDTLLINAPKITGYYKVIGQIVTYNTPDRSLKLYVQPDQMYPVEETINSINEVEIAGTICKKPVYRTTPNGRQITELLIADRDNYIPCITWGNNAKEAIILQTGDKIYSTGRLQSRDYYKNNNTYTTYEISLGRHITPQKDII